MAFDPKFGPYAQTDAQRAQILHQLQTIHPGLFRQASQATRQLYARYVAGELSWREVQALREDVPGGGSLRSPDPRALRSASPHLVQEPPSGPQRMRIAG